MTDDLDLAAEILSSLTSAQRAAIMAEMDPSIAARLSKIMKP
jgi:flagellar motility protein MotE (MotC chaperone)